MDTNTLLIIIVLVLLLGGGGWYAPISAIALALSRMPRIYSAVASFAKPQPSCSKFFLVGREQARAVWKSELLWIISSSFGPRLLPEFPQN
jgi:hypothetical protein